MSDRLITTGAADALAFAGESEVRDFVALLKPRVMSLVVFTGAVGLYLAPGHLHPVLAAIAILCIAVGAGAAGAINMWYERDIDALMTRTRDRPIPAGRMDPAEALAFGIVLSIASVVVMALAVNLAAAAILALSSGFYVFVYTVWLTRRTPQTLGLGGAAGAFPPMIGGAAVTGDVSLASLALFRSGDYAKAGVPMLPVTHGAEETRRQILLYTVALLPVTLSPWFLGFAGLVYLVAASVLGLIFLAGAVAVYRETGERAARGLFGYSIVYLFLLFGLLVLDRTPGYLP